MIQYIHDRLIGTHNLMLK